MTQLGECLAFLMVQKQLLRLDFHLFTNLIKKAPVFEGASLIILMQDAVLTLCKLQPVHFLYNILFLLMLFFCIF